MAALGKAALSDTSRFQVRSQVFMSGFSEAFGTGYDFPMESEMVFM